MAKWKARPSLGDYIVNDQDDATDYVNFGLRAV
jgi:hypothetical protein